MFKRIALFLGINILIVVTVSLILNFFNVAPYLQSYGLDYKSLAIFCLIWGMAGALISLMLSRQMAKWVLGVRIIDRETSDMQLRAVVDMVAHLSRKAGLPAVPEVGVFNSPSPNAFATGPTKRKSLVAVSTGLLNHLSHEEIEAVIGHEISHIANGDMVTMTLLQGVINAFVMFLARVLAFALSGLGRDRDRNGAASHTTFMVFTFIFELIFMIAGAIVVAYYSRQREFRADKGSSDLLGKEPMISALRKLESIHAADEGIAEQKTIAAMMINDPSSKRKSFISLFASHPPIQERINRLQQGSR